MAKKTIMLVCAAGMSTSLLVSKMQKAAAEDHEDVTIFATAASDAQSKIESEHPDILMLGPQVNYLFSSFKERETIPVEVINMQDYGMMNGRKVLEQALKDMT
ncbi:PTS sugar transporter subunit IIB [Oenococcus kitaharae]|uniref:PTS sugar transporter subunit IIB n=2 Tax=Oenococcus TaxID=46254 RepID=UPI0021E73CC4|nr:PTS sugar transporter subunit IIB [Oenococcus kitaharae]MCV3296188.1 PTS sugar transporter subunit IIB [Oenococcus kitaharae]